jgi:hypothetical protein
VHRALLQLRPKYRTALLLHYFEKKSASEISQICNRSVGGSRAGFTAASSTCKASLSAKSFCNQLRMKTERTTIDRFLANVVAPTPRTSQHYHELRRRVLVQLEAQRCGAKGHTPLRLTALVAVLAGTAAAGYTFYTYHFEGVDAEGALHFNAKPPITQTTTGVVTIMRSVVVTPNEVPPGGSSRCSGTCRRSTLCVSRTPASC